MITWTDGVYGPNGKLQDTVTYAQTVSDPVKGYLNIKVSYGSAKIIKTSEDGKVEGISFTITGNGVNKTVTTGAGCVIQIDNPAFTPSPSRATTNTSRRRCAVSPLSAVRWQRSISITP